MEFKRTEEINKYLLNKLSDVFESGIAGRLSTRYPSVADENDRIIDLLNQLMNGEALDSSGVNACRNKVISSGEAFTWEAIKLYLNIFELFEASIESSYDLTEYIYTALKRAHILNYMLILDANKHNTIIADWTEL